MRLPTSIAAACGVLVLAGCGTTAGLKEPLATFSSASSRAIEATTPYFNNINADARRHAFHQAAADPSLVIEDASVCGTADQSAAEADENGPPLCFFDSRYDPDQITVIVEALGAMKAYTEILGKLASDDTVKEGQAQAETLGKRLEGLTTALGGSSPLGAAVSAFTKALGTLALERERYDALRVAIDEGDPALTTIIEQVAVPAAAAAAVQRQYLRENVEALNGRYRTRSEDAVAGRAPFPEAERLALLRDLEAAITALETAPDTSPAVLLQKMQAAHDALVLAVEEGPRASPAAFRAAVIEFSTTVEGFASAVNAYDNDAS